MREMARLRVAAIGALVALILITLVAGGGEPGGAWSLSWPVQLLMWCVLAMLAASHRPLGGAGLGFGTLVLPPATDLLGPATAALIVGVAWLLAAALRRASDRRGRGEAGAAFRLLAAVGVAVAAWVGAALWASDAARSMSFAWRAALPALAYLVCLVLMLAVVRKTLDRRRRAAPFAEPSEYLSLVLDFGGWVLGALLTDLAGEIGWTRVTPIVLALALLAAEAARNALARGASDDRVGELRRMHQAHERILGETSGMASIADQILVECSNVLPVFWYQFELYGEVAEANAPAGQRTWAAGPDGMLQEGLPDPEPRPPMLPGIHRRTSWRVIDRPLAIDGVTLARVCLWCDPRQIEPGAEELFETLVPQMASSVHRAQLDREARLDPLTGVPVRRILDSAMQRAFRGACDEGHSMAVIMCDIDHFKQVNDTHGHAAGDEALILVAQALDRTRRENDLCCRYGGEEFTILLENASGEAALGLAERLRKAVSEIDLVFEGRAIPLALSAGVAAFPELHIKTASELLLLADEALYEAKRRGRNRCLLHLGHGAFRGVSGPDLGARDAGSQQVPRIFG